MSQVTLYLPDELAKAVKQAAERSKQSVSSYIAALARKELEVDDRQAAFLKTHGTWLGEFPPIDDQLPEDEGSL